MTKIKNKFLFILLFVFLYIVLIPGIASLADEQKIVRVGIYENEPKIFTGRDGHPSGFWPDIISYIANAEGWEIKYVPGTWSQCLERLANNEIDIMPDVAFTEERNRLYLFTFEPVYTSWSRVFTRKGIGIQSVIDLEGRKVAVLQASVNYEGPEGIKTLTQSFGITCTFIEVDSYSEVFQLVKIGEVDAGVTSKDFGNQHQDEYNLVETPILFQPSSLYFALPVHSDSTALLAERIDFHIRQLKADPESIYYKSVETWLGGTAIAKTVFPEWLKWVLGSIGVLLLFFIVGSIILRFQVRSRTRELAENLEKRIEADKALEESEEKYRTFVERSKDGICIIQDGKLVYINSSLVEMSGYTYDELINTNFTDHVHPDELAEITKRYTRRMAGNTVPSIYETVLKRKDKSDLQVELNAGIITYQDRPADLIMARDISERKLMEESIQLSEEYYRSIVSASPDGIALIDRDGLFSYVSEKMVSLLGVDNESELIGNSPLGWLVPEQREKARTDIQYVLQEEALIRDEQYLMLKKDGSSFWVAVSSSLVKDNRGNPVYIMAVVRDITEQKKAREELQIEKEKAEEYLAIAEVILLVIDDEQHVTMINRKGCEILGYESHEIIGTNWFENYLPERYQGQIYEYWDQLKLGIAEGLTSFENPVITRGGEERLIAWNNTILRDMDGNFTGTLSSGQDITEQKQAEEALKESEEKNRIFTELTSDYVYVYNRDEKGNMKLDWIGGAFEKTTGYTLDEYRKLTESSTNIHPEDISIIRENFQKNISGETTTTEVRIITKEGNTRWISNLSQPIWNEDKSEIIAIYGTAKDITDRKIIEQNLINTNRALTVLSQCNEALVRSMGEESLLKEVCRIVVESGGYLYARVNYRIDDDVKSIRAVAQFGLDDSVLGNTSISWSDTELGQGPTGTAIRTGEVCVIENTLTDPKFAPWRKRAEKYGYLSAVSLPLSDTDTTYGALTIYSDVVNAFTPDEISLLSDMANDLSYGIISSRARFERDKAEQAVRDNEQRLIDAQNLGRIGNWEYDLIEEKTIWYEGMYEIYARNTSLGPPAIEENELYYSQEQMELLNGYMETLLSTRNEVLYDLEITDSNGNPKTLSARLRPILNENGEIARVFGIVQDVTEQKKAEEALRFSDAALKSIRDIVFATNNDSQIIYWNDISEKVFGIPAIDTLGKPVNEILEIIEEYPGQSQERLEELHEQGYAHGEVQYKTPNGSIWVNVQAQAIEQNEKRYGWVTIASDITERKLAQSRQRLMLDILEILNGNEDRTDVLNHLLSHIKDFSGIEAVGIRLKDGDDYPYAWTAGFVEGHVESENRLCMYDGNGEPVQDMAGNPLLACMCGNIIAGRFDPSFPFFTEGGSFWTNSTTNLLSSTTEEDRQATTRNLCNSEGYESVALIPVRAANETIGLLQFNDMRENMFDLELIQFYESVAASIGIAFDRTLTQEELEREKRRVERILSTAQTIILVLDMSGNIVDCNPYMEGLSGYSINEIRGENWFDLFIPERDRESIKQLFQKATHEISTEGNVNAIITKDGRERYIVWYDAPIRSESGDITGLLSTGQDITDLRQAEELYNTIASNSPVGVYISQEGRLKFVNPEFQRLTGYTDVELYEFEPYDLVHPNDKRMVRNNAIKMLKGEITTPYEFRVLDRDGAVRWAMESVTSIHYNGKPAVLGSFMDITENKLAEEAVRQSEEKLGTIIKSIPQGIMVTGLEGTISQVNASTLTLFGLTSEEEIIGKNALDFALVSERERILEDITKAREENRQISFEYSALRKDGTTFSAMMSIAMIHDTEGVDAGIIGVVEDVSERQKMQEQLIVTDRLASVGELAAGIAHELNNPLTGVVGFSDLIMSRSDVPEDIRDDLEIINREALRASQVARHLLTFARKHPDEKNPVNVNDIIRVVMELRAYEQKVNNITALINLRENLPEVMANDFQLQQVFLNIIINAEFFMSEEYQRGILSITTEQVGDKVRIIFEDDGPGIPPENLSNIFNPFYTTKEIGKGTGLGLSICHGIITEHEGTLYAESEPGKGARFIIELPAYHEEL